MGEITDRPKKGNGLAPKDSPLCYSLLGQFLSDTNLNLEDAVCPDPTDTSYVQENYHDEIAGCYCNIFDDEEEDTDEETNLPLSDKPVRESTPRKNLWWKLIRKEKLYFFKLRPCHNFQAA